MRISNALFLIQFTEKKNLAIQEVTYLERTIKELSYDQVYKIEGIKSIIFEKGGDNSNQRLNLAKEELKIPIVVKERILLNLLVNELNNLMKLNMRKFRSI